jgi:hypothetical protein
MGDAIDRDLDFAVGGARYRQRAHAAQPLSERLLHFKESYIGVTRPAVAKTVGLMTRFPAGTTTECQTDCGVEFSAQKICVRDRRVNEFWNS